MGGSKNYNSLTLTKDDELYLRSRSREPSVAVDNDVPRRKKLSVYEDQVYPSPDQSLPTAHAQPSVSRCGSSVTLGPAIHVEEPETIQTETIVVKSNKPVRNRCRNFHRIVGS